MKKKIIILMMILLFTLTLTSCFKPGKKPDDKNTDKLLSANVLSNVEINIADAVSLGLVEEKKDRPEPVSMVQRLSLLVNDSNNGEVNKVVLAKKTTDDEVVTVDFGVDEEFEVIKLKVQRKFTYIMIAPRTESGYIEAEIEGPAQMSFKSNRNLAPVNDNRGYPTNRNMFDSAKDDDFDNYGYYNNDIYQSYVIDNDTGDIYNPGFDNIQNIEENFALTRDNVIIEMNIVDSVLQTKEVKINDTKTVYSRAMFSDKYGNVFIQNERFFESDESTSNYIPVKTNDYDSYYMTDDGVVIKVDSRYIDYDEPYYTKVTIYEENGGEREVNITDDIIGVNVYGRGYSSYEPNYLYIKNLYLMETSTSNMYIRITGLANNLKHNLIHDSFRHSDLRSGNISRIMYVDQDKDEYITKMVYVNKKSIFDKIVNNPNLLVELYGEHAELRKNATGEYIHARGNIDHDAELIANGLTEEFSEIAIHKLQIDGDNVLFNKSGDYKLVEDRNGVIGIELIREITLEDAVVKDWTPINRG